MKHLYAWIVVLSATAFVLTFGWMANAAHEAYAPQIDPADFSTTIDNPYFSLTPGEELVYEGQTDDGLEHNVITITGETKEVMGVTTLVQRDRVWLDGELIEDTRDYFAQNSEGDVWYFGEDVDNYEGGVIVDHGGSWLAGVDSAQPGIIMEAHPKPGDTYWEEFYAGVAEDMAKVESLHKKVSVPFGDFEDCLRTRNVSPLEPGVVEYKYYCTDVASVALEINRDDGERLELVDMSFEE
jgi:hypothetical protein